MGDCLLLVLGEHGPQLHVLSKRASLTSSSGPASSEVTRVQQAHWELRSLECSRGREVLSMPQDLPSTGTLPAGLALCATLPVTLWVNQGAP